MRNHGTINKSLFTKPNHQSLLKSNLYRTNKRIICNSYFQNLKRNQSLFNASSPALFTTITRKQSIGAATVDPTDYDPDPEIGKRATLSVTIKDYPGALAKILNVLSDQEVNMTRIESKYGQKATEVNFIFDVDVPSSHRRVQSTINALKPHCLAITKVPSLKVHWFPITSQEVDSLACLVLDGGTDLEADHPGFHDIEYKKRRAVVTQAAQEFKYGDEPVIVNYAPEEIDAWNIIWRKLQPLLYQHACPEYIDAFEELRKYAGYKEGNIPQLADVSGLLKEKTGFKLRPTSGLLSSRHFLNGLAFNTFFCTQYLRHHTAPFYTPEPDVVHELVGHAPMFANPEFAKFSQEIGLASIGATDTQIEQLARCYWFSVEFGLCRESPSSDERKIYGAGILSSFGEIEHCMTDVPEIREWDPANASQQPFPITKYQPLYYLAKSFDDATLKMKEYANSLDKPFTCRWNDVKEKLYIDRNLRRLERKADDFGEYIGDAD